MGNVTMRVALFGCNLAKFLQVKLWVFIYSNSSKFKVFILKEDYIIKGVDLFSGFGGTIGLWLGWSAMTLGDIFLEALKTLFKIRIIK